jgi:hypothetical protein
VNPPDPRKSYWVFVSGKKGWGKSRYCRAWFDGYPFDRMVIDVTGDLRDDFRRDGLEFTDLDPQALPVRFPVSHDDPPKPVTCVLVPDMGAATWEDDIDRGIGLCLRGKDHPCLLWVDEYGAVTRANRTQPNMRRVLHHGRHHDLSLLLACPRPKDVDGLGIAQADLVVTGPTPNPYDRERIANEIGFDPAEFGAQNQQLRVEEHTYTAYDSASDTLYVMPALPARRAGRNLYPPVPS